MRQLTLTVRLPYAHTRIPGGILNAGVGPHVHGLRVEDDGNVLVVEDLLDRDLLRLNRVDAEQMEDLLLHRLLVDTDRAAAELDAPPAWVREQPEGLPDEPPPFSLAPPSGDTSTVAYSSAASRTRWCVSRPG